MTIGICSALLALACCSAIAQAPAALERPGENIALHRPYSLDPGPNYALCTDDGDKVQLTDGQYVEGYFWTQQGTVGWQNARPVHITVDLGSDQPICGVSYSTAAGVAGVEWPGAIQVYVSDDGKSWWSAGELIGLSAKHGAPPASGYATHRYWTGDLKCHGRYVCLQVEGAGAFTFCDEVEVYRGSDALLSAPREGSPVSDLKAAYQANATSGAVRRAVLADAATIREQVEKAGLTGSLAGELDAASAELAGLKVPPDWRAILPYSPAHERVLRVRAAAWRAAGMRPVVWQSGRWDPLQPGDPPPTGAKPPAIDLVMLRSETRGAALNVTNPTEREMVVRVSPRGLPGGEAPGWLTVHEVAWTAMANGQPVGSALPEAKRTAGGWEVHIPAGVTRQIWLSVDSATLAPRRHRGTIELAADGKPLATVPLSVRVSKVAMPEHLALSLGGWDYNQSPTYAVTNETLPGVVAFLKRYHLDAPWAQNSVMPFGTHDASGRMSAPPNTSLMDSWLERWKGARFYFVFADLSGPIPDTPEARRRIADWITFWAEHVAQRGVKPSQLGLLLLDEPREKQHDEAIVRVARIIHEAQPDVLVFEDPIWPNPRQTSPEMLAASNILCPNRPMWLTGRKSYEQVYLPQQQAGKMLAFYSCSGPVRTLDPYAYHRLQAWDCFRYGMVHEGFWAFGDTGGGPSSWNEFASPGAQYCPQFLDPSGCTTSKHMEAIREGLYDHQTLTLLKEAVAAADKAKRRGPVLEAARRLLVDGPKQVTEAKGAEYIHWAAEKDRSLADQVRLRAIELLEKLTR